MKNLYFIIVCFFISILNSFGQTWVGSVSSDWNTAANWTPANVPTVSGKVTIDNVTALHQPVLAGDVNINTLDISAGSLDLNGFALTCSGAANFTGGGLQHGKISANTINNVTNMQLGGKLILEKTGSANGFWDGNNKAYGDSLIVIWRLGTLHLQSVSADSIFTNFKVQLEDSHLFLFALNAPLYVQNDLILDDIGNGTFSGSSSDTTIIGGNLIGLNFSSATPNLLLTNFFSLGSNANGPFYCQTATIDKCSFNGNFTLVSDSSNTNITITNSSFLGADNLFQAGSLWTHDNRFGQAGPGSTIIRAAYDGSLGYIRLRGGNNKFFGNAQWETYAVYPGAISIEHTFYGPDTTLGNLSFILKGNANLQTNSNGNSYVNGNLIVDGQGSRKALDFSGGSGVSLSIGGSLMIRNFSSIAEPGVGHTNVSFRNTSSAGADSAGAIYCFNGIISGCNLRGDLKLIADSSQPYTISNSVLAGADNLFQAGYFDIQNSRFGQMGTGTTTIRAAHNLTAGIQMRDGNNKFLGNAQWETYAAPPGSITLQQTFYGADSCLGNMSYILKGYSLLTTNGSGNSYVGGDVILDGQGNQKWVQFTGGGPTFTVGGNFIAENFTPYLIPGTNAGNLYLHNVTAAGTDTCGTFFCYTGDINNCSFHGNLRLIADSSQLYTINNSVLAGADNLFQAGNFDIQNSRFGQMGTGMTTIRAAHNLTAGIQMRDGNNKFLGNAQWETYAAPPGSITLQQTFHGADSCLGNMSYILKGYSLLTTNGSGNSYVGGDVILDGQGNQKWVQFTGGGPTFTVGGNFIAKNFTPYLIPGTLAGNLHLRNVTAAGTDTCGTFFCYKGDINNCSFHGNLRLIADSSQLYTINNSVLAGADNLFQAGNFDIQNSRFGQAGSGTSILKVVYNLNGGIYLRDGKNKFLGNAEWHISPSNSGSVVFQNTFHGTDTSLGNLTVTLAGSSSANLGSNNLYMGKGLFLQNNGSGTIVHDNAGSALYFIGTDTADFSYGGSGSAPALRNIGMNRQGGLRLMSPLTCSGLNLARGIVLSSLVNPLKITNSGLVVGGWDSSYVDGPLIKAGNTAFTFPLGKNNVYAPLGISAPALLTDEFRAQYFNHRAHNDGYDSSLHDISLHHISRMEYWTLSRLTGTSQVKVTLSWKTLRSGPVDVIPELRVAHWNGALWKDEGIGGTTGTVAEGTIESSGFINDFSPFTLASATPNNPLPVTYYSFDVTLQNNQTVLVQWKTAAINNDHFEIEWSRDGASWTMLASVAQQASEQYSYLDMRPQMGSNYYRIKQVDNDGKYSYSTIKGVIIGKGTQLLIWPNPATDILFVQCPKAHSIIEITDMNGRRIFKTTVAGTVTSIPVGGLRSGVYLVIVQEGGQRITERFIKQ